MEEQTPWTDQTLRTRGWEKAGQAENPRKTVSGREQSNSTGKGKEELAELVELVKSGKAACWWTHSWGSRAWMGFGQREQKGTTQGTPGRGLIAGTQEMFSQRQHGSKVEHF